MYPELPTDPAQLEHQELGGRVAQAVAEGRMPSEALTYSADQRTMWTMPAYLRALRQFLPSSGPRMPGGADQSGDWREGLKDDLRGAEGFEAKAYPDAVHGDAAPTVGYGFNLASPVSRAAIKQALGYTDTEVADLVTRKRELNRGESERVLDHIVTALDGELTQALPGVNLNGPQRRALLNLSYNSGLPNLQKAGVLDAVKTGDPGNVVRAILSWGAPKSKKTGQPLAHVAQRRKLAAMTFLGGDAERFQDLFR